MSQISYEQAKKDVFRGFWLLFIITIIEVIISLFGKGWLGIDVQKIWWLYGIAALVIIGLSVYKAKYIIMEFMHLGHEVQGLRFSVLLPTALLIWAIIAFFQEGDSWKNRRELIKEKNAIQIDEAGKKTDDALDLKD
jgi:cytochrome c oxidase subunit IV